MRTEVCCCAGVWMWHHAALAVVGNRCLLPVRVHDGVDSCFGCRQLQVCAVVHQGCITKVHVTGLRVGCTVLCTWRYCSELLLHCKRWLQSAGTQHTLPMTWLGCRVCCAASVLACCDGRIAAQTPPCQLLHGECGAEQQASGGLCTNRGYQLCALVCTSAH